MSQRVKALILKRQKAFTFLLFPLKEFVVEDVIKPAVLDVICGNQYGAIPKSSTTMALISMLHTWSLGTDGNGVTVRTVVKALANGFNICFNILLILLNGNVESVCHPLSAMLKRVETC